MIDQNLVKQRIELGLDWIISNQNQDKSFGELYPILNTALVVLELEQYAISIGVSPLDVSYKYYNNLVGALEYLFSNVKMNDYGIYYEEDEDINLITGVVLASICSSQAPEKIINNGPNFIQGLSYKNVAQYIINYLTYSQDPDGGWGYSINNYDNVANNYVSGYIGLGLLFAKNPLYKFDLTISDGLVDKLTGWVNYIQNTNGGSGYSGPDEGLDILKTGNLLLQMHFLNFSKTDSRVTSAVSYKANMWYEPACFMCQGWNSSPVANYQATYAIMSGLTGYGFSQINQTVPPFNQINYIDDITTVLLEQQNINGSFNANPQDFQQSDKMLSSIWALLTLQAVLTRSENITIELSSDKPVVKVNDIVTYTVKVSNIGNINILNSIIKDELPAELSFIDGSVTIDELSYPEASPITGIKLDSVSIGQKLQVSFKCTVLESTNTNIDNRVSINFGYYLPYGIIIQNKTNYSNIDSIKFAIASLGINAELNKTTAVVGEILTYTININNNGGIYLNNIVILDSLDPNLQYMNNLKINGIPTDGSIVNGVNIGTLNIGETTTISFDIKIISVPPSGTISTQITANFDYDKPVSIVRVAVNEDINKNRAPASDSVTVNVTIKVDVVNPEVSVSKTCSNNSIKIGETAIYTIEILNSGKLDSISTKLIDILPIQLQVVEIKVDEKIVYGDLTAGINLGSIASGGRKLVYITVKGVEALESYRNTSITTMEFLPIVGGPISTLTINVPSNNTLSVTGAKLVLTQLIHPTDSAVGGVVRFDIKVQNTGGISLKNTIVSNLLPSTLQYIPESLYINGCKEACQNISCGINLGIVNQGQEYTIQFKVKVVSELFNPIYNFSQAYYYYDVSGTLKQMYSKSNIVYLFID